MLARSRWASLHLARSRPISPDLAQVLLTVPDGRENPLNWAFAEATRTKSDARYEKVYYPRVADDATLQAVMTLTIMAVVHANRLLVEAVGGRVHVTKCVVGDYVPSVSQLDKWTDQLVERVEPGVDKLRGKLKGAWASLTKK